ncbi:N-acetylneuraminate epimerase [Ahrensia sp. 13_GOM-1096m]|uniref:N-acetylneuraminate epimerase n=1 Tax=Ahrensia sp. 13_GOM-1096m TaxID=1380380 RepID=UPI0006847A95|nr:N-acetylneuraminate epimerase [Ahrensia sp. 13_GOM-1096m]
MRLNIRIGALISAATMSVTASTAYADGVWPDLPVGFKNGIFAQDGSVAFVGLGSAGKALFSMDLAADERSWKSLSSFPGPDTSGATFAMADGKLFVFSGSGKMSDDDASPIIFTDVYSYEIEENVWEKIETSTPVGLLGASAHAIDDDRIAIFGGYNKELFDKYLNDVVTTDKDAEPEKWQAIVDAYMGMPPRDYHWNNKVLVYTISTNSWSDLGENPFLPNTGSAVVEVDDGILLINGEIKPGLRTPQVKHISFEEGGAQWHEWPSLPARVGDALQEGLASPFAGYSGDALIVAGGANFQGARARSFAEQWFTHDGYPKAFNADIYVMRDGWWKEVNDLPEGLAYGATFKTKTGILAVGGEDGDRNARTEAFELTWNGETVVVTD